MITKIHSFESLATLDGDGIRYAIFFLGCPLRCVYCHNPDTWDLNNGKEYSTLDVLKKIKRCKPYFGEDGGVTFTGGEPLLNAKFINELNELLMQEKIRYALDTSGSVFLSDDVKKAIQDAELIILDLKFWDKESYKKYANGDMDLILKFLDYINMMKKRIWVRTVVIPNINDKEEILDKYIEILKDKSSIEKYELLAFHTMGFFKYEKLGLKNPLKDCKPLDNDLLKKLQDYVNLKLKR